MKQDWLFCKHQLAMHLSTAMDHFITLQVTDKEFTKLLNENWNIKEWWLEWNKWKMKTWLGNYGQLSTMTVSLPCCSMHFCTALIMVASRRSIALRWAGVRMGQRGSRRMLRSSSSERDILSTDSSASLCHVEERNLNVRETLNWQQVRQKERETDRQHWVRGARMDISSWSGLPNLRDKRLGVIVQWWCAVGILTSCHCQCASASHDVQHCCMSRNGAYQHYLYVCKPSHSIIIMTLH